MKQIPTQPTPPPLNVALDQNTPQSPILQYRLDLRSWELRQDVEHSQYSGFLLSAVKLKPNQLIMVWSITKGLWERVQVSLDQISCADNVFHFKFAERDFEWIKINKK